MLAATRRWGIAIVWIVLLLVLLAQRYFPEQLAPSVAARGRFLGDPIRLKTPNRATTEVAADIRIKMDRGICRGSVQQGSKRTGLFNACEGTCRTRIPTGSELILDPQGQTGDYEVTFGPDLFSPMARCGVLLLGAFSTEQVRSGSSFRSVHCLWLSPRMSGSASCVGDQDWKHNQRAGSAFPTGKDGIAPSLPTARSETVALPALQSRDF
ncbi:MAG: hypothetical protein KGS61_04575 [Verrucomicrobia bacterium]|nr:hypothetical protein [Verrucomicrobiota bacterium]